MIGSPKNPKYFLALLISKLILLTPGIWSMTQFNGAAIINDETEDTVGKETSGIPK